MSIKYRPHIDGLRALAVISVVIYHAFKDILPGGFVGVDVFFVISGYLITLIILKEIRHNEFSIMEFYRRRINRIFPALLIVLISVLAFCWFTFFTDEFMQLGKHAAGGAGFVANIVLYNESGYFDLSSEKKPLLHLWSLGVEEQFYIFLPILLIALHKLKVNVFASLSFLALLSLVMGSVEVSANPVGAFYLPQYRAWELLSGSLIACLSLNHKIHEIPSIAKKMAPAVGMAVLLACIFTYNDSMPFPGLLAIPVVAGSCLVVAYAENLGILRAILSNRLVVFIGLISYPLYLWHWPVISIMKVINGQDVTALIQLAGLALSFLLSVMTYLMIERPLKRTNSVTLKTIPLSIVMCFTGFFSYFVFHENGVESRAIVKNSVAVNKELNGVLWDYIINKNCTDKYHFEYQEKMPIWFCELTYSRNPDVLLLGNSYANHLYPGVAFQGKDKNLNVLSIGTSEITYGMVAGHGSIGEKQMHFIDGIISNSPSIKYVIVSGLITGDTEIKTEDGFINYPFSDYVVNFNKRIDTLVKAGKKVIIFSPHIKMNKNIKACFSRPLKPSTQDCNADYREWNEIKHSFDVIKSSVLKRHPEVMFFDPNSTFCRYGRCSSVLDGMPVYRDDYKHMSEFASRKVGSEFYQWLDKNDIDLRSRTASGE